jgi:hypothetical protein
MAREDSIFPKPSCIVCTRSYSSQTFISTLYAARGRKRSGRSVLLMKAVKCYNYIVLVTDKYSMNVEQW